MPCFSTLVVQFIDHSHILVGLTSCYEILRVAMGMGTPPPSHGNPDIESALENVGARKDTFYKGLYFIIIKITNIEFYSPNSELITQLSLYRIFVN